jgi:pimeloyl-ACP methyl ester carboxylesterase
MSARNRSRKASARSSASAAPGSLLATQWKLLVAIVLPILGVVWLVQGAHYIRGGALPQHTIVIDAAGCRMPTTVFDPAGALAKPQGSAVVLHGLSANRRIMFYLAQNFAAAGLRVYVPDLPGHGDNTEAFSFARAHQCATAAVESLIRSHQIDPTNTILVGHSMGAAIAIAMADREPLAATIAISPGPLVMPKRMPSNLLVFVAQFDIPAVKREADAISAAAGMTRTEPDDFAQNRAFQLITLPHTAHTSGLYSPEVVGDSFQWIEKTTAAHPNSEPQFGPNGRMYEMGYVPRNFAGCLLGSLNGLLGLLALAASFIALAGKISALPPGSRSAPSTPASRAPSPAPASPSASPSTPSSPSPSSTPSRWLALLEFAVAAFAAVFLLKLGVPLRFLHIYSGDYLVSAFLIIAVLLLALNRDAARSAWCPSARQLIPAAVVAFVLVLGFGAWLNWQLTDVWMNAARWLRFAGVLPFAFLFCFAEEVVLGPVRSGRRRALRYLVFFLCRAEIWVVFLLAYYELNSGQFLILLLAAFFALFSLLARLGTDAFRRRNASPTAAALFGAILLAWFVAAVLPLS